MIARRIAARGASDRLGVRLCALSTCAMALLISDPALAQDPPAAQTPAAAQDESAAQAQDRNCNDATPCPAQEEDIVVTAQRRSERIQDVPITISNVSPEMLENTNTQALRDIGQLTAGVRFDTRASLTQPTIRGIASAVNCASCGAPVGVYVDGFYSPSVSASTLQLNSVESIQVLKGPQGTLFGRNAVAGAFLINTSRPSTNSRLDVELGYGSYNARRGSLYATTGLSDSIAVDLALVYGAGDGWTTNIFTGNDEAGAYENVSLRAGLLVNVTDNFSLLFRYVYTNQDDPTVVLLQPGVVNGVAVCTACYLPGAIFTTRPFEIASDEVVAQNFTSSAYQLTALLDLSFGTLTSLTQYRDDEADSFYSNDYATSSAGAIHLFGLEEVFTQELLLTSNPGSRFQYTLGLFYLHGTTEMPVTMAPTNLISPTRAQYTASPSTSTGTNISLAGYADVTYEVVDGLFLTAGLRYTRDRIVDALAVRPPLPDLPFPTLKSSRATPRAVIRYEFNDATSAYASFSVGYKSAIYNVSGRDLTAVRPEQLLAYELGFRHAARRLSLSLSGYYYRYTDQQTANSILVNNQIQVLVRNAASSNMYGIDAEARYQLGDSFEIFAAANWSHARYDRFTNAPGIIFTPQRTLVNIVVDASGFNMQRAPDFSATGGATYRTELAGGRLALSANFSYQSDLYFDVAQQVPGEAYALLGARVAWTDPSDRFTFAVTGRNLTDTTYYSGLGTLSRGIAAQWGAPRTIEASIRARF